MERLTIGLLVGGDGEVMGRWTVWESDKCDTFCVWQETI